MNIRKTITSTLLLLCVLLHMLPGIAPLEASAFGSRGISEVNISFSMPPVEAADVAALSVTSSTGGCFIRSVVWYDIYGQEITNKFTNTNATVEIIMEASSGYYFPGDVVVNINGAPVARDNYGSELCISASYSPVIWAPTMVKHPSDETVYEGDVASFVSYSSCTNKSSWQILDTEGTLYSVDAFAAKYPDLYIEDSFEKLNISPVTMELNGYKVRCNFTGPGGDVTSNYAAITVEKKPLPTPPSSAMAPAATPAPTPVHEHVYSTELSSDAGYHWYGCPCGAQLDREEHSFDWTQNTVATVQSPGSVSGVCSVCGYVLYAATELDPAVIEHAQSVATEPPSDEIYFAQEEETRRGFFGTIADWFGNLFS